MRLFIPFLKYQVMKILKLSLYTLCNLITRGLGNGGIIEGKLTGVHYFVLLNGV